ncbi:MAG: hypothetical protein R3Y58_03955 [Eubacteriales bacterium]
MNNNSNTFFESEQNIIFATKIAYNSSFIKNINEYLSDTNSLSQKEKLKLSYEMGLFFPIQKSKHSFAYNWIFPNNQNRESKVCITEETITYTYNDNPIKTVVCLSDLDTYLVIEDIMLLYNKSNPHTTMFPLNIKGFYIGEYINFLDFLYKKNIS